MRKAAILLLGVGFALAGCADPDPDRKHPLESLAFAQGYLCGQRSINFASGHPELAPAVDGPATAAARQAAKDGFTAAADCGEEKPVVFKDGSVQTSCSDGRAIWPADKDGVCRFKTNSTAAATATTGGDWVTLWPPANSVQTNGEKWRQ